MNLAQSAIKHYDDQYYAWQSQFGSLGALANQFKFVEYIKPTDTVLDFGCGGGFLLQQTNCQTKLGIEVNPLAQEEAIGRGLTVYASLENVQSGSVDVVISNHALEHVEDPMLVVREFRRVLKDKGLVIIVTPYDVPTQAFDPNDKDFHLFGWSPSNLGNLVKNAGFEVLEAKEIKHAWPPKWHLILRYFGTATFHVVCKTYAHIRRLRTQIRVVAQLPY